MGAFARGFSRVRSWQGRPPRVTRGLRRARGDSLRPSRRGQALGPEVGLCASGVASPRTSHRQVLPAARTLLFPLGELVGFSPSKGVLLREPLPGPASTRAPRPAEHTLPTPGLSGDAGDRQEGPSSSTHRRQRPHNPASTLRGSPCRFHITAAPRSPRPSAHPSVPHPAGGSPGPPVTGRGSPAL